MPNPPPTSRVTTRIRLSGTLKMLVASCRFRPWTPWLDV